MKAFSSAVSITVHCAVGAAVLFGATKTGRSDPGRPREVPVVLPPIARVEHGSRTVGDPLPMSVVVAAPDPRSIPGPTAIPGTVRTPTFPPVFSPTAGSGTNPVGDAIDGLADEHAEVLTGPLPVYPDLLRQAGVEGKVTLEAVVDTTGRVLEPSILVVSTTNPGFVAPARRALLATLFRPAMVGGKPIRMRVRIPYEFTIRNGTGHAR